MVERTKYSSKQHDNDPFEQLLTNIFVDSMHDLP